jgi:transcriptional regulator with XRE-family HTH domain
MDLGTLDRTAAKPAPLRAGGREVRVATHSRKVPADRNMGLRIEVAMMKRGVTSTQLAAMIGRTKGAVSHWTASRYEPPRSMIEAMAKVLRVTPEWLMGVNLSEEDRAFERIMLELMRKGGPEILKLIEDAGIPRTIEVIREHLQARAQKPSKSRTSR